MKPENDMYNSQGYSVAKGGYPGGSMKDKWLYWIGIPILLYSYVSHRSEDPGFVGDLARFMHHGGSVPDPFVTIPVVFIMAVTLSHCLLWPGSWLMDFPPGIKDIPEERSFKAIFNALALALIAGLISCAGVSGNDVITFFVLWLFTFSSAWISFNTIRQMGLFCFIECAFWGLLICMTLNALFGDKKR